MKNNILNILDNLSFKALTFNIQVLNILLNYKKFLIRSGLIICWVLLYYNSMLTFDRIKIFIILIFIILIYKIIYNYFEKIYQELKDESAFYVTRSKYDIYIDYLNKIIYILLFIQKWRNPVLVFLLYTDKKIYNVMRFIYEILISYGLKQEQREIFNMIIIYIFFFGTIKVLFGRFYIILGKWSSLSFLDVFFNRIYGSIISILVFSDIISNFQIYITNGILSFLILYFFLSLIFICIELCYIFRVFSNNMRYSVRFLLLIRNSIYTYVTTDLTIYHRMHYTILGRIITIISEIILDIEEDDPRYLPNAVVGSYKACVRLKKGYYIMLKYRYRYTFEYIDNVSCQFLVKYNYLETSFVTYWEFLKRNYYKGFILIQDRKNYPSAYLFHSLVSLLIPSYGPGMQLMELYYYKLKCLESNLVLNEIKMLNLEFLFKFDILRLKIVLYILWDILEVVNFDSKNWIKEFNSEDKDLLKWANWNVCWNILEINKNSEDLSFLKVNQEIYRIYIVFHFFKKELKLYDIENNVNYFIKLFDYLGYVKTDYAYEDVDAEYKEMCGRYYISPTLESYSEKLIDLWKYLDIDLNFNRKKDLIVSAVYENRIELYFKNLIKDWRKEWVELKLKEPLDARNNRLLCELKHVYKQIV